MPNGMYGGVRGKETKIGRKTFVSLPTRFLYDAENVLEIYAIKQIWQRDTRLIDT